MTRRKHSIIKVSDVDYDSGIVTIENGDYKFPVRSDSYSVSNLREGMEVEMSVEEFLTVFCNFHFSRPEIVPLSANQCIGYYHGYAQA